MVKHELTPEEQHDLSLHVREVKRVTWVALIINILLSAFKITAGTIGSSQAVAADGVHSISDTSTDLAVLIGVRYWSAPPDETHPHGHRRIETVITLLIGLVLALIAVGLSYNAIVTLGVEHTESPDMIALVAALVSIFIKETLYQWTVYVGRKADSPAVVANAWHQRSDALSSIPAALAVGGAIYRSEWYFLDHIGAVLVSLLILHAACKIAWPALKELTDHGAPEDASKRIEEICLSTDGVIQIHKIRTRRIGPGLQVDLHIQVKESLSVRQGHDISEMVKSRLREEGPRVIDAIIHLEPFDDEE